MNGISLKPLVLPAEWGPQSGVQLTFPHADTDWAPYLHEAVRCFSRIACEISRREKLLVVAPDPAMVLSALAGCNMDNVRIVELNTNDTWARDHGGISVLRDGHPEVLDFAFNGWGNKFDATLDNEITGKLFSNNAFSPGVPRRDYLDFVLEGGSIESDGQGTILTTSECLLSPHRNAPMTGTDIEAIFKKALGANRVLWLDHGYLEGDDTDSHIDTLARFCDPQTIAYVRCDDESDVHFDALQKMETALSAFTTADGRPYRLIPLPMADPMVEDGERLPATYANFLIINDAVLMPAYNSAKDEIAARALADAFLDRQIVPIDCRVLVKQHGSLHCVTMQYPPGVLP
jgi:agmatine deiminase